MNRAKPAIHAIIFDFDNTLLPSDAAYEDAFSAFGADVSRTDFAEARRDVHSRLPAGATQRHHRLLYLKAALPHAGPKELLQRMHQYERALAAQLASMWRRLGRTKLFMTLKKNRRLIVLTNENTRTQLIKWRACDPHGRRFDAFITSEEVGLEKPHPHMFEAAVQASGAPKEACLMVGDSLEDDLRPAQTMGLQVLQTCEFMPAAAPLHPDPQRRLKALDALPAWLP